MNGRVTQYRQDVSRCHSCYDMTHVRHYAIAAMIWHMSADAIAAMMMAYIRHQRLPYLLNCRPTLDQHRYLIFVQIFYWCLKHHLSAFITIQPYSLLGLISAMMMTNVRLCRTHFHKINTVQFLFMPVSYWNLNCQIFAKCIKACMNIFYSYVRSITLACRSPVKSRRGQMPSRRLSRKRGTLSNLRLKMLNLKRWACMVVKC